MKQVIFKKQPLRFLKKLDSKTKQRIVDAIYSLPDGDVKTLKGHTNYKRLRVGSYRIIFDESGRIYTIIKIGNRGDVYK
ncbi:MAG: type II toxin-antitoxin system RelE family toxin [Enterococcus avium]